MLTLAQFKNPKDADCVWRLSKRRERDENGVLQRHDWITRCVDCSDKHQLLTHKHNQRKKETRNRIRQEELIHLRSGKIVQVLHTLTHLFTHSLTHTLTRAQVNSHDLIAWPLFAKLNMGQHEGNLLEKLRQIAAKVGVGMVSIRRQLESWPTRSLFYRRHHVQTKLLSSDKGDSRRLAWLKFLRGAWRTSSMQERVVFECDVHLLTLKWTVEGCPPRELDWSWGGFRNMFTLAGGDERVIVRWRPSVRHALFDDDHVVCIPHNTINM